MQELELTDGRIVRVWWLLTWRSFAGAFVGGFVISFVIHFGIGFFNKVSGATLDGGFIVWLFNALWMFFWQFIVVRMMLRKHYKGFRLAIVADDVPETAEASHTVTFA